MKDQLANVDRIVAEHTLVIRLVAGLLDSDYDSVAQAISQTTPLPSFEEARSQVLLKASRKAAKDNAISSMAL